MGAASVSEYVASLNEEQRRHISAFIDFMSAKYPQLTSKISFSINKVVVYGIVPDNNTGSFHGMLEINCLTVSRPGIDI